MEDDINAEMGRIDYHHDSLEAATNKARARPTNMELLERELASIGKNEAILAQRRNSVSQKVHLFPSGGGPLASPSSSRLLSTSTHPSMSPPRGMANSLHGAINTLEDEPVRTAGGGTNALMRQVSRLTLLSAANRSPNRQGKTTPLRQAPTVSHIDRMESSLKPHDLNQGSWQDTDTDKDDVPPLPGSVFSENQSTRTLSAMTGRSPAFAPRPDRNGTSPMMMKDLSNGVSPLITTMSTPESKQNKTKEKYISGSLNNDIKEDGLEKEGSTLHPPSPNSKLGQSPSRFQMKIGAPAPQTPEEAARQIAAIEARKERLRQLEEEEEKREQAALEMFKHLRHTASEIVLGGFQKYARSLTLAGRHSLCTVDELYNLIMMPHDALLMAHIAKPLLRIIDCRPREVFDKEHIRGSVHVTELTIQCARNALNTTAQFDQRAAALDPRNTIVFYGDEFGDDSSGPGSSTSHQTESGEGERTTESSGSEDKGKFSKLHAQIVQAVAAADDGVSRLMSLRGGIQQFKARFPFLICSIAHPELSEADLQRGPIAAMPGLEGAIGGLSGALAASAGINSTGTYDRLDGSTSARNRNGGGSSGGSSSRDRNRRRRRQEGSGEGNDGVGESRSSRPRSARPASRRDSGSSVASSTSAWEESSSRPRSRAGYRESTSSSEGPTPISTSVPSGARGTQHRPSHDRPPSRRQSAELSGDESVDGTTSAGRHSQFPSQQPRRQDLGYHAGNTNNTGKTLASASAAARGPRRSNRHLVVWCPFSTPRSEVPYLHALHLASSGIAEDDDDGRLKELQTGQLQNGHKVPGTSAYEFDPDLNVYPNLILSPWLFLGDQRCAWSLAALIDLQITHIVNISTDICNYFEDHPAARLPNDNFIKYLTIRMHDDQNSDIYSQFQLVFNFIDMAKKTDPNAKIMVHCQMGISRSASLVIAYIMHLTGASLKDIYYHVKARRYIVQPNKGFWQQLGFVERELRDGQCTLSEIIEAGIRIEKPPLCGGCQIV